ncbi:MAG: DUF222 domain-containing protein [Actinomycetota bacterium]
MFTAVHDELDGVDLRACLRPELRQLLAEYHRIETHAGQRRLAVMAAIDALEDDGLPAAAESRAATHRSSRAADRDAETATVLATLPGAADSLAAGAITLEHAERLSTLVQETSAEQVAELIPLAEQIPADLFRTKSNRWLSNRRSRAAIEEQHRRQRAERGLSVWFEGGDAENGALLINGRMDNATGRQFQAALRTMIDRLWRDDGGRDGAPNGVRTPTQRRIDALAAMATTKVDTDTPLPVRTMLHLVATVADHSIEFLDGQPVPQAFLDTLDPRTADVVGHVFSGDGKPLWTGRRHRLATVHQWTTLIARDRGCVDCGADVAFTEAHHLHEWSQDGRGDIDNLELKCHADHALAHRGSRGDRRSRPRAA